MPKPLYFHPFVDKTHYIGFGPKFLGNLPSAISLHCVAPTFGKAKFKYAHSLGHDSFSRYTDNTHRIYVMGHCAPGLTCLSTETGRGQRGSCSFEQLADLFMLHGLPDTSQVVIRIHACHSASNNGHSESFAKRFKDEMIRRDYHGLTIQGYTVGVGAYLINRWGELPFSSANIHRSTV
jgi:hypothetical protein